MAALHGVKTLVIGLDMQCDISNAIMPTDNMEHLDFDEQLRAMSETRGLYDFYQGDMQISDLIMPSDLEYLHLIPETPELVLLNDHIGNLNRREFWLNDRVISKLRNVYDLIILDCSPSWNRLITNALCVTDLLVSPVECKINNLRNVEVFNQLLDEFKNDMRINFSHCLVPTKYSSQKKLSKEIYDWYQDNFENTLPYFIRESVVSEEAMALNKSLIEFKPTSRPALEMKEIVSAISHRLHQASKLNFSHLKKQESIGHGAFA